MKDDMLNPAVRVPNSRLTCAQCERMILDAMEESLGPEDRIQFDLHVAGCPDCVDAMADAQRGSAWLEMLKIAPPEPPDHLVERILAHTSGDAAVAIPLRLRHEPILAPALAFGGGYAAGQTGFSPGRLGGFLPYAGPGEGTWLVRLVRAITQPRFAMTAAMAFFSIALTMNLLGVHLSDLHSSAFTPVHLRHSFWSANARAVRYYENLRVVYELESRVRELQRASDDGSSTRHGTSTPRQDQQPQPPARKPGSGKSSLMPARTSHAETERTAVSVEPAIVSPRRPCAAAAQHPTEGARV